MKKINKKKQLLIMFGLLIVLLVAVAIVQKVQETRRGATGTTKLVDLELQDLSDNPNQPLVERPGQEMELAVKIKAKNADSMVGVRVAGVELKYSAYILNVSDVQCAADFPVPIYSSVSGGLVKVSCYRPNNLGPYTLTTSPVSLATFKVSANNLGDHLTAVVNFTRTNVTDATASWTGKVEDVSDNGLAYVVPLNHGEVPLDFACSMMCGDGAQLCPHDLGIGEEVDIYAKLHHWGDGEVDYDWKVSQEGQELPLGQGTTDNCAGAETCQLIKSWSTYSPGRYTISLSLENAEGKTTSCSYIATVKADPTITPTQECTISRIQATDGEYNDQVVVGFDYNCPLGHQLKITKDLENWREITIEPQDVGADATITLNDPLDCGQSFEYCVYGINLTSGEKYGIGGNCDQGNTSSCVGGGCNSNLDCFYTYTDQDCVLGPVDSPAPAPEGTRCLCDTAAGSCMLEDVSGSQCTIQGGVCTSSPCGSGETDLGLLNCMYSNDSNSSLYNQTCCKLVTTGECSADGDCAWFNGICTKRIEGRIDPLGPIDGRVCGCDEETGQCIDEPESVISISPEPPTATLTPEPSPECTCDSQEGREFKALGDGDCDGETNTSDYNAWFDVMVRRNDAYIPYSDFNCDGEVSITDFEVWRRGMNF